MKLSEEQLDALGEIVNIGVGRAAASLSELLGTRIELRVPRIRIMENSDKHDTGVAILQSFEGDVSGTALLAFPAVSGQQLAKLVGGYDEDEDLPPIELSGILSELGNIVLNGVLGSIANVIETDLTYTVPDFFVEKSLESLVTKDATTSENATLIADASFSVKSEDIHGSVVLGFELGSLENLLDCIVSPTP